MKNQIIKKQLEKKDNWPEIQKIIKKIANSNFQIFIAGGAVRDALLKKTPKDIDLASSAVPKELIRLFPSAKGNFAKYGVVFIPLKTKEHLEITSFRKDSPLTDGRRPQSISYSSDRQDALRRDFTVNAMFYDPLEEKLIDFTKGLKDLKNKTLRTVGLAKKRFEEDYLRPLRALRLSHQLNFKIEEQTRKAIPLFAKKIQKISNERITDELNKMFSAGQIGSAVKMLKRNDFFYFLFPELKNSLLFFGLKSGPNSPELKTKPASPELKASHLFSNLKTNSEFSKLKTNLENISVKKAFEFWNQNFSFLDDRAFLWTVFALPFFYKSDKNFKIFLQNRNFQKAYIKKSLSYLKAVQILTTNKSLLIDKLKALDKQKKQVFELAYFWLKVQSLDLEPLKKALREFEKRQEKGRLPKALITGFDLLKNFPSIPQKQFPYLLKKAFKYQIQNRQTKKSEVLESLKKNIKAPPQKKKSKV